MFAGTRRILLSGTPNIQQVLGGDLLAMWDAARTDLITIATGVSAWNDIVAGYSAANATGSTQPIWSATSFGGSPGITFDGVADMLTMPLSGQFPSGANPVELWALVKQDAPTSDATARFCFSYGAAAATAIRISRAVVSSVNRASGGTGNGTSSMGRNGSAVDLSTRHVIRWQVGATQSSLTVDGTLEGSVTVTPSITATRLRIGASANSSPSNFWQGAVAVVAITNSLSQNKANIFQNYLLARRRL